MTTSIEERQATWAEFLKRWPIESLNQMTLPQYTQAGDKDCFTNWLETRTENLGSIWGGSAFKFGVFSRKDLSDKTDQRGLRYDAEYGWFGKYGETSAQAFTTVKNIISQVAHAARKGDLATIEAADLGTVTKWKIAFLFQDSTQPCVLPIFKKESLHAVASREKRVSCSEMHVQLMAKRNGQNLLTYGDELWGQIQAIESAKLSTPDTHAFLMASDRFTPIKLATDKMAGFRTAEGLEVALALDNKTPTLYLSQGIWLTDEVRDQFTSVIPYAASKSRSSNIPANAPSLIQGNAIVKITVPTRLALVALCEAYDGEKAPSIVPSQALIDEVSMPKPPLNQILFGPPGTGKTFATINTALEVLDPAFLALNIQNREALKRRFDEFKDAGRMRFVTFHQSFSYEDFVEGIRADTETDDDSSSESLQYRVEPGVFAQLCTEARRNKQLEAKVGIREGAKVWKLSIEEASSSGETRAYCLSHGEARIGWAHVGNLNTANLKDLALDLGVKERKSLENFGEKIVVGDVVVCLASRTTIGAVGVVTGEYEYTANVPAGVRKDYVHKLPIHWLATGLDFGVVALNNGKQLTLQTVYPLGRIKWPDLLEALTAANVKFTDLPQVPPPTREPYVLVIDEINRGNISRIFGELITLIEPSKRTGEAEALETVLPYSRSSFGVPANVYLIGTMNTADRSLAGLDVALRRRFVFKEMPPKPELLDAVEVDGVNVGKLLRVMNQRIEALLDREHALGHAYFMPLEKDKRMSRLGEIFRDQVLPLLQEYFFDDWQRIQWVLNDHRKPSGQYQFIQRKKQDTKSLFGEDVIVSQHRPSWQTNATAFDFSESYLGVIDHTLIS